MYLISAESNLAETCNIKKSTIVNFTEVNSHKWSLNLFGKQISKQKWWDDNNSLSSWGQLLIYLISFWDWDNLACRRFPILILENPWQMSRLALYANEKRAREAGLPFQLLLLLSKTVTHQSKTRSKQQLCHRTWAPEGRRKRGRLKTA